LIHISKIKSKFLEPTIILIRRTTWKCGKVERRIINYLKKQLQQHGQNQSSVKDMIEYFKSQGIQRSKLLEAIKRLEKRNIIKIIFLPFSRST
jgi:hypothetical protein